MGNDIACCATEPVPTEDDGPRTSHFHCSKSAIKQKFEQNGQEVVFKHWDTLSEAQQDNLTSDCKKINVQMINNLFKEVSNKKKDIGSMKVVEPELVKDKNDLSQTEIDNLTKSGLETIKAGRAAVVLLAGGQGTRLGSNAPKGMYKIGLHSNKSIFQVLVERFLRAQMSAHGEQKVTKEIQKCKMLVMTSQANHNDTVNFFKNNKYFGAQESSFIFFPQDMLPQLNKSGKIMLEAQDKIKMGPNGNGGFFAAASSNKKVKGVLVKTDYVQIIGVDNIINKVLDPVFIGYTKENKLHAAGKAVIKRDASEKVGVFCRREVNKKLVYDIAEYSEIAAEDRDAQNQDGSLQYNLGYILVLVISSSQLLKLTEENKLNSMFHRAEKKTDCFNATMKKMTLNKDSYKYELFLHSFLQFIGAGKFGVLKVNRETEFAPIKNANDAKQDCPDTAREQIYGEAEKWLIAAGYTVKDSAVGNIEISPLLSYNGENMDQIKRSRTEGFFMPTYIDQDGNLKENPSQMITEDGAKVPAPVKAAVVVNQAKKEDDNAESPAEHKIEELLKPQTIIRGALLVTKEEASANQRGPYLGSDRERIAKDILDFAQQQIDANYDLLPKDADKKTNQEVRQGYINNGKVPITILTRDVTNITYEQFKKFLVDWYSNSKTFVGNLEVTNPETIDGCPVVIQKQPMPMGKPTRSFVPAQYNVDLGDSYVVALSTRGNESVQQKYQTELTNAKTIVSELPLEYIKICPINSGLGVHMTYILSKDMQMSGMEKTIAGKQKDYMKGQVDKIKKFIK